MLLAALILNPLAKKKRAPQVLEVAETEMPSAPLPLHGSIDVEMRGTTNHNIPTRPALPDEDLDSGLPSDGGRVVSSE